MSFPTVILKMWMILLGAALVACEDLIINNW